MQPLDAEALCLQLAEQIRPHLKPDTVLVGIRTGGLWLAERLHKLLDITQPPGAIDTSFYRDDYGAKGLHASPQRTEIPFSIEDAPVILIDDVLYTGRTTRAALNEIFDFGRPASVELAVLVDRGGRELPVAARYCAVTLPTPLPSAHTLQLERATDGSLNLRLIDA
ncbi:bifunctional pyr operon transcriptional regulator/uracil phosphoribosyltransferase [Betaproteobacteria bacterium]|nr:bifunctional pyr operon transcriptional regulator/uracil phosphoribosyltransferase [Betaproteobacteria bacterium]GHT93527.1 bifunctional pyr operon transcriptional regulator/uracil phosphoribosyltransferase [Betaproteobacteria bacterium]GHT99857.1 bifunctional pyr operon transcriptional regulator/uracil phosphoribosyltransferase [Betaproteobacteria bacterium]GHU09776.1 bifunctional pyr operon transcriptional regulator/uracil phosphoribosyltransferase [Betaproteobacteria bacterium]GHU19037.1 